MPLGRSATDALVDIGRRVVEAKVGRPPLEARAALFAAQGPVVEAGVRRSARRRPRRARRGCPRSSRAHSRRARAGTWPAPRHARRMLIMQGCVQPVDRTEHRRGDGAHPRSYRHLRRARGRGGGCCGALPEHLGAHDDALAIARRNVDAWWPAVEAGAEAIIVTASGCGVTVRDYAQLLADDAGYAAAPSASRAGARSGGGDRCGMESDRRRASRSTAARCASRFMRRARCSTACRSRGRSRN